MISACDIKTSLPDYIRLNDGPGTPDDIYYSVFYDKLPQEFTVVAEKELNENEENLNKGLRRLREFVKKEKFPEVDDSTLTTVLRTCKYDFKKSETKLKKYLRARRSLLSKVEDLDLEKVAMVIEDGGVGVLPFRDRRGRAVFFTRPNGMDDEKYTKDELVLTGVACAMFLLTLPLTSVAGISYIGDCKFRTISSLQSLLKSYHQYMWTFLDFPLRLQRIDFLDEHFLIRWFYNIVRPFVSPKILGRVTFFGNKLEDLQRVYHPDILPEEFGGKMGPIDCAFYKSIAVEYVRTLKAENQALKAADK